MSAHYNGDIQTNKFKTNTDCRQTNSYPQHSVKTRELFTYLIVTYIYISTIACFYLREIALNVND